MSKKELIGMKWGALSTETRKVLLEGASCIDGETCKEVESGDCIVDLKDDLSVAGKIIEYEIIIDDEAIIYDPAEGII
ncbi:hypothetical protein [Clostridium tetani]|uniref:hypothetical protein n=1 Tax=Clostridium tetani TaxID=1513 RepID=UPI001024F1E9|nr:hypothetical protein [Clostridium tetani]RXI70484.1 hypothetical protein DP127_09290 [Clostridium tetani]